MTRVAIIGAGPCGMSLLQAFRTAEKNGDAIPEVVCYEKQSDWGGLWISTVNRCMAACIDTFGQTDRKSAWNSPITALKNILGNPSRRFHQEKC